MCEEGFDSGEIVFGGCEVQGVLYRYCSFLVGSLMGSRIRRIYLTAIALAINIRFFPEHKI